MRIGSDNPPPTERNRHRMAPLKRMKIPRRLEDPGWPGHFNDYVMLAGTLSVGPAYWGAMKVLTNWFGVDQIVASIALVPVVVVAYGVLVHRRYARRRAYRRSRPWPLVIRLTPEDIRAADRRLRGEE